MNNILRVLLLFLVFLTSCRADEPRRAEVLFIGAGNKQSSNQATWLSVELFKSGINLMYPVPKIRNKRSVARVTPF